MLRQIYANDPHQSISGTNNLQVGDPGEIDLESTLQFTSTTGSAYFDFSVFLATDDGSNALIERQKILDEVNAFQTLRQSVEILYHDFLAKSTKALEILDGLA